MTGGRYPLEYVNLFGAWYQTPMSCFALLEGGHGKRDECELDCEQRTPEGLLSAQVGAPAPIAVPKVHRCLRQKRKSDACFFFKASAGRILAESELASLPYKGCIIVVATKRPI
jgi:hypothetical protein